jgi:type IV secretory pathway TrbF-like protein
MSWSKRRRAAKQPSGVENPYLASRRTWDAHVGDALASRRMWQLIGIASLLIALAAVGGIVHFGSQSRFVPYVVEVDKLGSAVGVAPAIPAGPVDERVMRASLAAFISNARLVTPDVALQRKAIFEAYAMLGSQGPAMAKMNEWYNATPDSGPFKRAEKETANVEITSVMPLTKSTWQIDWVETERNRQGVPLVEPAHMRAVITVYINQPTAKTTEKQIQMNPLGIYVKDFAWAKQL